MRTNKMFCVITMASHKRLSSVVQSIAHHSVSALSYVHPHLSEACEKIGLDSMSVILLAGNECPSEFLGNQPLTLGLRHLSETLANLLIKEGFDPKEIKLAKLTFEFQHGKLDHYCSTCTAELTSPAGSIYRSRVNYLGNTEQNAQTDAKTRAV
ncbi:hypothetical protein TUM3794_16630 [Shewanella colwelliana]|uniref:Uncharacterized protein n=1 Tax=Shewanella colwelliana TaxID=23 RepID=A0ABQ4NYE7_SHECO|nr:hypothetical protein [Shewanella colwelliana]GIU39942.1 hypothetical protein TUM3794_16630 [Shewanella colwelliana]